MVPVGETGVAKRRGRLNQEGEHPVRTSEALKIGDAWPRGEAVTLRAAKGSARSIEFKFRSSLKELAGTVQPYRFNPCRLGSYRQILLRIKRCGCLHSRFCAFVGKTVT